MDDALRWRLDAILGLLSVIAVGILGIAWTQGAIEATASIFVLGALLIAAVRRPSSEQPDSEGAE